MTALLQVAGIGKRFGGFSALTDIHLTVPEGQRLGIIGPNGSGKTTLINCISGALRIDQGTVHFSGNNISKWPTYRRTQLGIARSFQLPRPFHTMTPAQNIAVALQFRSKHQTAQIKDIDSECSALLEQMGLAGKREFAISALTQVDLRRLELARALATRPRLLILDEVMAGLSSAEVDSLLENVLRLSASGITILMVEHIMRAIMRFSERVVCLDAGTIIADSEPERIVNDPTVRKVYLGA